MSKTVVVPTGNDLEYYLAVTVDEAALVRAVRNTGPFVAYAHTVTPSESLRRSELDGNCAVLARDVAVASILTGRNIRQDLVIPWGSITEHGQPVNSPTWADRGYGDPIPGHPDLFSFLEDSEYDPAGFVRDRTHGRPMFNFDPLQELQEPRSRWRCYGLSAQRYWDGGGFATDDTGEAYIVFATSGELRDWEDTHHLLPCAWELTR